MIAEVDARGLGEVSEVPKGETEEKCGCQDLHKENNGVMSMNGSNAHKEDSDGSSVFVSGNEAVSDDHVEPSDLNGEHVKNLVSGGVVELNAVENGECNGTDCDGGGSSEGPECEIKAVRLGGSDGVEKENGTDAAVKSEQQPQRLEVEGEITVESSDNARDIMISHPVVPDGADSEFCESSMQVPDGKGEDRNLDSTSEFEKQEIEMSFEEEKVELEDGNPDSSTDGKENFASLDAVSVVVLDDLDQEKEVPESEPNEFLVEGGAPGCLVVDVELNPKAVIPLVTDTQLKTEVGNNGPFSDENGDGCPASHTQASPSETLDANQEAAEQNGFFENSESLPSPSFVCGNAAANEIPFEEDSGEHELELEQSSKTASETETISKENGDSLSSGHPQDSISENVIDNDLVGAIQNTPEHNGSFQNVGCLSSPVVCGKVPVESLPIAPDCDTMVEDNAGNGDSSMAEKFPMVANYDKPETGVGETERSKAPDSCPVDCTKLEIEAEDRPDETIEVLSGPEETVEVDNGTHESIEVENGPDVTVEVDDGTHESIEVENGPLKTVEVENGTHERIEVDSGTHETVEVENGHHETVEVENGHHETVEVENGSCVEVENGPHETLEVENGPHGTIEGENETDETIKAENGPHESIEVESGTHETLKVENGPHGTIEGEDGTDETIKAQDSPDYSILCSNAANDAKSEVGSGSVTINSEEKVSDFPTDATEKESGVANVVIDCVDAATDVESHVNGLVENDLSTSLLPDGKSETEVENKSTLSSRDIPCDDGIELESKVSDSANLCESALNCVPDSVHVADGDDQFTGADSGDKPTSQGAEGVPRIPSDETSTTCPEVSALDALEGQNAEVVKRPFYYLIRLPRYDDENLREKIKHAQLQVDEKTRIRDAIRAEIQMKRAAWKENGDNFEAVISEERAARDLLRSKRQEMDSAQSMINRVKNAISVEDIDVRIRNMEHAIQHETLPLKEEKQLIREIKQLKQLREQLSSSMGKQDDVQEAIDQKDQIEERLKFLRKELDVLRSNVLKAEAVTKTAKKKSNDENEKMNQLQAQFRAADVIRQEAYAHLQSLKKQFYEKNKHFWKFKDDINAANDLASERKREELQELCFNQVEKVMELWNENDEFRKEYIRCNTRSTLRRLRTLDGRSLGPDEEPPLIPNVVKERVAMGNTLSLPSLQPEKHIVQVETVEVKGKVVPDAVEQKKQTTKSKKPVKLSPLGNGLATVSGRDEIEEVREEEPKLTKQEEELARKREELRREEEATKSREQQLLEEKVKAKEALERKKRNAEKAHAKAMLRAQKEAEEKEKEREKKARKKERKKAGAVAVKAANGADEGESTPSSETATETPKELETREKPSTVTKRSQKPSQFTKQSKAKPIPPPLRNRSKRRMQPWMWVLLAAVIVLALFLVGNSSFSFDFGLQRFGF
ncbi:Proton pump-interactor 1 [Morella rubra]|uniref:Proton pump-interactor 1 n=1 Tax=Morella rubra TaxID=262757 RepID=A0A6A1USW7_9ROSI|nr:Proton pump-interactor 1 [Morella rubra]